jgi:hypothetical protein
MLDQWQADSVAAVKVQKIESAVTIRTPRSPLRRCETGEAVLAHVAQFVVASGARAFYCRCLNCPGWDQASGATGGSFF